MIEHYKNKSLVNIVEVINGITYTEEWKDIVGFEGIYKISNFGRVKRLERIDNIKHKWPEIILKSFASYGYRRIGLKNKKQVKYQVHRLVATAFLPNPLNISQVNHKKGVRWDNRAFMLEWVTCSENHLHSYKELGRKNNTPCKGRTGALHHNSIPVIKVSLDGFVIEEFGSIAEAERETKIGYWVIANRIKSQKPINGYYFK
jgi:hypothetical protein